MPKCMEINISVVPFPKKTISQLSFNANRFNIEHVAQFNFLFSTVT